eukprot:COSAG01_NODE_314_length_19013_cov_164.111240_4_plen_78_part_00
MTGRSVAKNAWVDLGNMYWHCTFGTGTIVVCARLSVCDRQTGRAGGGAAAEFENIANSNRDVGFSRAADLAGCKLRL